MAQRPQVGIGVVVSGLLGAPKQSSVVVVGGRIGQGDVVEIVVEAWCPLQVHRVQ
jgi:hypothetical protein